VALVAADATVTMEPELPVEMPQVRASFDGAITPEIAKPVALLASDETPI